MAKKRKSKKLFGAALAAHQKKVGKRANPHKKHSKGHKKPGKAHRGKRHNNPKLSLGNVGQTTMDGLIAAGILFGSLLAVGFVNRQAGKVGYIASGWQNVAAKVGIALGFSMGAAWLVRKNKIQKPAGYVIAAVGWAPVALAAVNKFAPTWASQISLAEEGDMGAAPARLGVDRPMAAELSASLRASLEDELEAENEMSMY